MKWRCACGLGILLVCPLPNTAAQNSKPSIPTLATERKAARAEGLPLTVADMARRPPVLDDKNAIIPYREIMAELEALPDWEARIAQAQKIFTPGFSKEDAYVAFRLHHDTIPFLRRIDAASRLLDCEIFRDYSVGYETTDTDYIRLYKMAVLLVIHAYHQENAQKTSAALKLLAMTGRLCSHLQQDRSSLSLRYVANIEALTQAFWTSLVRQNQTNQELLASAKIVDKSFGSLPDFSFSWGDGIFYDSWIGNHVRNDHKNIIVKNLPGSPRITQDNVDEAELHALIYWRKAHAILRTFAASPFESYQKLKSLEAQQAESFKKNTAYALAAWSSKAYSAALPNMLKIIALRRVRKLMLGLIHIKANANVYPEKLEQIVGVPIDDPFTGKPFHYERTEKGVHLYSVGLNFQDDKGAETSDDIWITLP